MTDFIEAYAAYSTSNKNTRADLWHLCVCTYLASQMSTIVQLADSIGKGEDSVSDWAKCGWLIGYCTGYRHTDAEEKTWTLSQLWNDSDALSYDHLLRAAKLAKRLELDPAEILERLYYAANGGQKAESLERDIEEAHEKQDILLRRDIKRIGARLKQNIDSLEFRGASNRLVLAFRILERRMAQELERLTPQGNDNG